MCTCSDDETTPIISSEDAKKRLSCHGNCATDSTCFRYTLMVVICIVAMGDYFGSDNPAALEDHMMKDLRITESRYMLFYSSIQWVQSGMCLVFGYLVDRVFGIRFSVVLAAVGMTGAHSLFAGGAIMDSFWTMVFARIVFGVMIGLEWMAINKMNAKWFKDKELTFVIALKMSLGRAGTVATMNLMDQIYSAFNVHYSNLDSLGLTLYVGAAGCLLSAIFSFGYFYMDKKAEADNIPPAPDIHSSGTLRLRNVGNFPLTFWLVTLVLVFFILVVFTFTGLGQVFFERKYGLSLDVATYVNSLIYIIGAVGMPALGVVIDKVGRNLYWMLAGILLQLAGHLLLAFTFANPYIAMALIGASWGVTSLAVWPLVSYVVHLNYLGTAFGIIRTCLCLSQAGSTYVAGYLAETYGYLAMEVLLLMFSCVALVFGTLLFVVDRAQAGNLNLGPSARRLYEKTRHEL